MQRIDLKLSSLITIVVISACNPINSTIDTVDIPVLLTLVTPTVFYTPTDTPLPTPTSPFTETPALFTVTPSVTPTNPPLHIVKGKITKVICSKNDLVESVAVELEIVGGASPYSYNTNILVDSTGIARAIVVSADKQIATVDFDVSRNCNGSSSGYSITITPVNIITPPFVVTTSVGVVTTAVNLVTTPVVVITAPPVINTTPPIIFTTMPPPPPINTPAPPAQPTNTPDFPQKECNDNYDNDGDGFIDGADPECDKASDNNESG